jgi:hypothetical protein
VALLLVGDVVGHGVPASATMGRLRERLLATGDLPTGWEALNTAASWVPGAQAATSGAGPGRAQTAADVAV